MPQQTRTSSLASEFDYLYQCYQLGIEQPGELFAAHESMLAVIHSKDRSEDCSQSLKQYVEAFSQFSLKVAEKCPQGVVSDGYYLVKGKLTTCRKYIAVLQAFSDKFGADNNPYHDQIKWQAEVALRVSLHLLFWHIQRIKVDDFTCLQEYRFAKTYAKEAYQVWCKLKEIGTEVTTGKEGQAQLVAEFQQDTNGLALQLTRLTQWADVFGKQRDLQELNGYLQADEIPKVEIRSDNLEMLIDLDSEVFQKTDQASENYYENIVGCRNLCRLALGQSHFFQQVDDELIEKALQALKKSVKNLATHEHNDWKSLLGMESLFHAKNIRFLTVLKANKVKISARAKIEEKKTLEQMIHNVAGDMNQDARLPYKETFKTVLAIIEDDINWHFEHFLQCFKERGLGARVNDQMYQYMDSLTIDMEDTDNLKLLVDKYFDLQRCIAVEMIPELDIDIRQPLQWFKYLDANKLEKANVDWSKQLREGVAAISLFLLDLFSECKEELLKNYWHIEWIKYVTLFIEASFNQNGTAYKVLLEKIEKQMEVAKEQEPILQAYHLLKIKTHQALAYLACEKKANETANDQANMAMAEWENLKSKKPKDKVVVSIVVGLYRSQMQLSEKLKKLSDNDDDPNADELLFAIRQPSLSKVNDISVQLIEDEDNCKLFNTMAKTELSSPDSNFESLIQQYILGHKLLPGYKDWKGDVEQITGECASAYQNLNQLYARANDLVSLNSAAVVAEQKTIKRQLNKNTHEYFRLVREGQALIKTNPMQAWIRFAALSGCAMDIASDEQRLEAWLFCHRLHLWHSLHWAKVGLLEKYQEVLDEEILLAERMLDTFYGKVSKDLLQNLYCQLSKSYLERGMSSQEVIDLAYGVDYAQLSENKQQIINAYFELAAYYIARYQKDEIQQASINIQQGILQRAIDYYKEGEKLFTALENENPMMLNHYQCEKEIISNTIDSQTKRFNESHPNAKFKALIKA